MTSRQPDSQLTGTRSRYDGDWVFSRMLATQADRIGDHVAFSTTRGELTYTDVAGLAARFGQGLVDLGVGPGDRVATMLDATPDYLAAWFGTSWSGGIDVPVNTALKGELLEHVVASSGSSVLVLEARFVARLRGLALPDLRHLVVVGEDVTDPPPGVATHSLAELLAGNALSGPVDRGESDLLYVMFTSGTTGPSKGAMLSNRGAMWNVRSWLDILSLTEQDVGYSMFPLFHVTARSAVISSTLWAGGRVALRETFSLREFWNTAREEGATFFGYMGAIIHLLYAQQPDPRDADNQLRVAFGAAAPPAIIADFERRFGVKLIETYGSTELGPASALTPDVAERGTMGPPQPHVQIEIHDADDDPVPAGVDGEIVVRPTVRDGIFRGYWGQPDASLQAFRNLWFHTGDGGRLTEHGNLVFTDRIKDSIRRRGENISSFEVERAVQHHPDVLECAAYAVPSELSEDEVMLAVVLRAGHEVSGEEVLRYCIETLPRFAVPRYLRFVEALPKTPSERIKKYLLRAEGVTTDTVDREALDLVIPRD
jgi:crotonobetaine/carnitine-CoA ligase